MKRQRIFAGEQNSVNEGEKEGGVEGTGQGKEPNY